MKGQTYNIVRVHRDRDGEWEKIVESARLGNGVHEDRRTE